MLRDAPFGECVLPCGAAAGEAGAATRFAFLSASLRFFHQPRDPHKNHCAHEGHDDRPDWPARVELQQTEYPAADNGAKNAKDDV